MSFPSLPQQHHSLEIDRRHALTLPPRVEETPTFTIYSVVDDRVTLRFHPGQTKAWESDRRFVFVIAGTQGGKTSFGPWWLWREINLQGSGDYLAVTANYDLFKLKMLPEIRHVFEDILKIARYWPGERVLEIRDPSTGQFWARRSSDPMYARVILRSAVAKSGLESSTARAAWLDECGLPDFSLSAWEAVRRRLSLFQGRVLGTTTPYDLGWLKTQIVDPWLTGDPEIDVIRFPSVTNPSFPKEEFIAVQKRLPRWKFLMMYRGIFTRPAGMIYQSFIDKSIDVGGHLVDDFRLPRSWPRYVGVDPGAVHQALIWGALDPKTGVLYIYRERLGGEKSTREHAQDALKTAADNRERVIRWFIGTAGEKQQRADWRDAGVRGIIEPQVHDVESGIDSVIERLQTYRIYFFKSLTGVHDELMTYSRVLDPMGHPTEQIKDKNTFHRLDALRYLVVGLRKRGSLFG